MTLPPFELHRPGSIEHATELLEKHGADAALYCGGTELLLLLKLGFASFGHLVDLKGIEELSGVRVDSGDLVVGASVTHRTLERSPPVLQHLPALAAMERRVANLRVREVGTLGGTPRGRRARAGAWPDPNGGRRSTGCRRGGEPARRVPIGNFVVGPYQTALQEGEVLVSVRIPIPAGARVAHEKFSFHERPTATVACLVRPEGGTIADARIAVGSVGPQPVRARAAEQALLGAPVEELDPELLARAGEAAADAAAPVDDANASADYKSQLVRVLVERTLREVIAG